MKKIIMLWLTSLSSLLCAIKPTVIVTPINDITSAITITYDLQPGQCIYKDYLDISTDHPDITLTKWECDALPTNHYDPTFKDTKKVFKDTVKLTLQATRRRPGIDMVHLHVAYYLNSEKCITQNVLPVSLKNNILPLPQPSPELAYALDVQDSKPELVTPPTACTQKKTSPFRTNFFKQLSATISNLAENTHSIWLRLLLVFFLGILMSLTPCIYPMIPITLGILQSRGTSSMLRNILVSCSYVSGIATTFALLGVTAAFTGQVFGTIMANPIVVLSMVALLIYLAFSMFGFYEMYIPKSLQSNKQSVKGGSLLSAFLFGVVSGSVASPCLSPGLVLLLCIVTTLGSKIMGFILLFVFGLGLGLPLLIIGIFSSSINLLPRAGMWMVEVKTFFGFMMLAICFYFLNTIMPLAPLLWLLAAFTLIAGLFYLYDAQRSAPSLWRTLKTLLGIGLIALTVFISAQAYKATYSSPELCSQTHPWLTDYEQARVSAQNEKKMLFVDIGAPFCTICKAIDRTVFANPQVLCVLNQVVTVKLDGSLQNATNEHMQQRYSILGFPTILLIDPASETVIKQWGSELYDMPHEQFADELRKFIAAS